MNQNIFKTSNTRACILTFYWPAALTDHEQRANCSISQVNFLSFNYISWIRTLHADIFLTSWTVFPSAFIEEIWCFRNGGVKQEPLWSLVESVSVYSPSLPILIPVCVRDGVGGHAHGRCFHLGAAAITSHTHMWPGNVSGLCTERPTHTASAPPCRNGKVSSYKVNLVYFHRSLWCRDFKFNLHKSEMGESS